MAQVVQLRAGGTGVVVDLGGPDLPRIAHWGADLGDQPAAVLADLVAAQAGQRSSGSVDRPAPFTVLPAQAGGWLGTPALSGHRDGGRDFSPALVPTGHDIGAARLVTLAEDAVAGLAVRHELEVTAAGLVRVRAELRNTGDDHYELGELLLPLPVPAAATDLLDTTGRHLRERHPQRAPFGIGTHLRESRRGRPGFDATLLLLAGEPGFDTVSIPVAGRIWGVHVAWSGNHRVLAERSPSGVAFLAGGELLLPGEVRLAPGEAYTSPWVYGAHGVGLDALAARFHTHLRARPHHPRSPRPVTLNTWEAVYFDHDLPRLTALADVAAEVGVERFVLDDGWFRGRRDDTAGLGDWTVDPDVWPDGLGPLVDHVRGLGLEFGLWVEPEMINLDSDLARAHPDWILSTGDRLPPPARQQQVLDLVEPGAFAHVLERLDALLTAYAIGYLKWDHNRDLVDAGHGAKGSAAVHEQTRALYRLLDALRARHPGVEIESCASGGGRVDLKILERTERIWGSDCLDPIERRVTDRWTGLLVPPEMIGSHIGSPVSHQTARAATLDARAAGAFFGHLGVEWDLTTATPADRAKLAEWIAAHKALRPLLHTGRTVYGGTADGALEVRGVVGGGEAVYRLTQVATSASWPTPPVGLPGLDPDAVYEVRPLPPGDVITGPGQSDLAWWRTGVTLPGRVLDEVGVRPPLLHPDAAVLVRARRIGGTP